MINLKDETIEKLAYNHKTEADVLWVGVKEGVNFSWEVFKKLADKEYDHGYGVENVALDLIIVGNSWWLERHEYDGLEWWEYKELPTKEKTKDFMPERVIVDKDHWNSYTLDGLHKEK